MTCEQLGGACDKEFHAATFEEMAELSRQHGTEMNARADQGHLKAMDKMRELMQNPAAMNQWMEDRRKEFDSLPDTN